MVEPTDNHSGRLGPVWVRCEYPVVEAGIERVLEKDARVYLGEELPEGVAPSCTIICFCPGRLENLTQSIRHAREVAPGASVLVFTLSIDLSLVRSALQAGARGFLHARMEPDQIIRALRVASEGEIVAPRSLLERLITNEEPMDFDALTARQREILELVVDGLSNAQIARQLYLSESTVKQHLRAAYKLLGVKSRTEAARVVRGRN